MNNKIKNSSSLFLIILVGIVLGNFLSSALATLPYMKWLNYSYTFGLTSPLEVDFVVFYLELLFNFTISIGSFFGLLVAIFVYKKLL